MCTGTGSGFRRALEAMADERYQTASGLSIDGGRPSRMGERARREYYGRLGNPKKESKNPEYLRNRFLDAPAASGRASLRIPLGELPDDGQTPALPAPAAPAPDAPQAPIGASRPVFRGGNRHEI